MVISNIHLYIIYIVYMYIVYIYSIYIVYIVYIYIVDYYINKDGHFAVLFLEKTEKTHAYGFLSSYSALVHGHVTKCNKPNLPNNGNTGCKSCSAHFTSSSSLQDKHM